MIKLIIAMLLITITVVLTVMFWIYILRSVFRPRKTAPYVGSFNRQLTLMKQLNIKKWATIIDLWCWDGKWLRFFNKTFDINKAIWYDKNPYAIVLWKIINKLFWYKNIKIHKKNFLKIDLKGYDYIYIYLRPSQLASIEERLRNNKDKKSIIISNSFEFVKHKEFETIKSKKWKDAIFLYK